MPELSQQCSTIAKWLVNSDCSAVFTGAGISTESGIPDFRSPGGVWSKNRTVYFDEFLSSEEDRHEYWRQKSLTHVEFSKAEPNVSHRILAKWEQEGLIEGIVTQNIDGLHQQAGSQQVWELHGTAREVACLDCSKRWRADEWVEKFLAEDRPPRCPHCSGFLKHATISFGQALPTETLQESAACAKRVELMLALGSSLVVYPAAGIPETAKHHGGKLVIINRDPTPLDQYADLVCHAPLGETMKEIDQEVTRIRSNGMNSPTDE